MNGSTPKERAEIAMISGFSGDVRRVYTQEAYRPSSGEFDGPKVVAHAKSQLPFLEAFAASKADGPFIMGKSLSYVDVLWYDLIDQLAVVAGGRDALLGPSGENPNIRAMLDAVTPLVADYVRSDRFIDRPFNNLSACFK